MKYNEPQKSYESVGVYADTAETIDTAESYAEAVYLTSEYQLSFGKSWEIYFVEL